MPPTTLNSEEPVKWLSQYRGRESCLQRGGGSMKLPPPRNLSGRGLGVSTPEIGLGHVFLEEVFEVVFHRVSNGHGIEWAA